MRHNVPLIDALRRQRIQISLRSTSSAEESILSLLSANGILPTDLGFVPGQEPSVQDLVSAVSSLVHENRSLKEIVTGSSIDLDPVTTANDDEAYNAIREECVNTISKLGDAGILRYYGSKSTWSTFSPVQRTIYGPLLVDWATQRELRDVPEFWYKNYI